MTYLSFLSVFLIAPLALIGLVTRMDARRGRPLPALAVRALAVHVFLAVAYTTPWDNYLVATRVWGYDPARVLGVTLGWVPLEEYLFFVLQTLLTGLCLLALLGRWRPAEPLAPSGRLRVASTAGLGLVWAITVWILATGWRPGTYLALILVWALPPIALQLAVGADILWHRRRAVLTTLTAATLYLGAADTLAIQSGVWTIDPAQSLGFMIAGRLPIEELVFFLVTNALVVAGISLTVAPETWARVQRAASALRRRRPLGQRA